ncbi:MAG: D-alanyl-D-alanine carboxypeptidase [Clostridia bacterium]|nr:D-alanyl-D-alanine carboxypeptidase [Clostridia bacterium]
MSKWRSYLTCLLALCCLLSALPFHSSGLSLAEDAPLPMPSVSAQAAVLMEAESGMLLYGKSADTRMPMASTTKIASALVALELASPDTRIKVSPEAVGVEGSSIYLSQGEELTLEELLYAMLLESANDAALAIAIGLSGSMEAFAEQMNRKATELGLKDTHFVNPHGLDHGEHYTTARELAILTREAMQNSLFREIVSTSRASIPNAETGGVRTLLNHNKLLHLYRDCIGVKTGFTKKSGRCLVSAAEREGVLLIAVTLSAPDDWDDHASLLDYGFSNYRTHLLCSAEEFQIPLPLVGGQEQYVVVTNPEGLSRTLPRDVQAITKTVCLPRFSYAPMPAGKTVGSVCFFADTNGDGTKESLGSVELIACYEVKKAPKKKGFWNWLKSLFGF